MSDTALTVRDLKTYFYTDGRCNKAVNGISFDIQKGKTLCIVGESGCGKSVTARAIMQLLPTLSRIESGEIVYHADQGDIRIDRLGRNSKEMRDLRGSEIAMIFQDPMTALNPVYSIGYQIRENLQYHTDLLRSERRARTAELLRDMGIPLPDMRADEFPHQFSGGMRQRAMIAMAMACNPKILIADEPTTALDVTIQAQIFELMETLKREHGTAIMLITHDMGVVAELADDVAVMYMGNIVEAGTVDDVLRRPETSLHQGAARLDPGPRPRTKAGDQGDPRRHARSLRSPKRLPIRPPLRFRHGSMRTMPDEEGISETHRVRCWHQGEVSADG